MFRILVAFLIVFGAIIWGQRYAGSWITERAAALPPSETFPATPVVQGMKIDPDALRRGINPPLGPMPGGTRR